MKVKDLMVGDWVMRIDVENPYPVQIYEILAEGVFVDNQNNHYINLPYSDIESIPLTPEILEKNGFKREMNFITDELDDFYSGIDGRVEMNNDKTCINSNNEWNVCVYDEDNYPIADCELTYVHELQHIFRLCRIDKEIII